MSTVLLIALALAAITIAVYAQVGSHDFIDLDDTGYIVTNPHVNTGVSAANIRWAFTTGYAANWHPVTWISHQIDASLFGLSAGPQHLVNLAWHVANTLLLFFLLRFMTGAVWRSAFVAGVFAVHPVHVESVAWMAERKDVLSTFFWLAATWMYVAWVRRPAAWRYGAMALLFALGLMSKPMLVTLPFALLLLDVWPLERTNVPLSRRIMEKAPLFAMALAMAAVTAVVQQQGGAVGSIELVPVPARVVNAIVACGHYLLTFVWPVNLAIFYPYVKEWSAPPVIAAAIAIGVLSALAWRTRRAQPFHLIGWLWFLGTLVPVIGLVQFGTHAYADRYTYLPYVGLAMAMAWGARSLADRLHIAATTLRVAGAAIIAALAIVAHAQAATWRTAETVWQHAVAVTENNARGHNLLGVIYANRGETAAATAEFQAAFDSNPDTSDARDIVPNLARSLMAQGKVAEALPHWIRTVRLKPDQADLRHQLALAYFGLGRTDDAILAWREAVRLNPNFEEAYFTMGIVLAGARRIDEARQAFEQVLRINPGRKDAAEALAALKK